jgi:hypothetical protein
MKLVFQLCVLCNLVVFVGSAKAQTLTSFDLRTAVRDHHQSYRFLEVFQERGRFILPRAGYMDFGAGDHSREFFVGGGYKVVESEHVSLSQGLYFTKAVGEAEGASYIQPWTELDYELSPKLGGRALVLPYIPLSNGGHTEFVVERVGIEYGSAIKLGVGYGAYQMEEEWSHSPFLSLTLTPASGKFGALEFWYQKLGHGVSQVQARYVAHIGRRKKSDHHD